MYISFRYFPLALSRVIKIFEEKLSEFVLGDRAIVMLDKLQQQYEILKSESNFKYMDASLRDTVLNTQIRAIKLGDPFWPIYWQRSCPPGQNR